MVTQIPKTPERNYRRTVKESGTWIWGRRSALPFEASKVGPSILYVLIVHAAKGMTLVDIREYYGAEDDEKPGKKGISLTVEQVRRRSHELLQQLSPALDSGKPWCKHQEPSAVSCSRRFVTLTTSPSLGIVIIPRHRLEPYQYFALIGTSMASTLINMILLKYAEPRSTQSSGGFVSALKPCPP